MSDIQVNHKYDVNWEWIAEYQDGSILNEDFYSEDPKNYGHIDHERLVWLWLVPVGQRQMRRFGVNLKTGMFLINGVEVHTALPEGERRLINFKRVQQQFGPDAQPASCRHGIGFQVTIDDVNYQQFMLIDPDGKITISNKK
jgi:hypothetical protein